MTEVRPLRLHDLPFAYRLAGSGISFDAVVSLTMDDDGIKQALMAGTGQMQAYVLRQPDSGALAQLHYLASPHYARLAYIAPALERGGDDGLWLTMLDGLTVMAGQRGVVTLIAEAGSDLPESDLLRQAGFAIYARQTLWWRDASPITPSKPSLRLADNEEDHQAVLSLFGSLVPGLIKNVEPPPTLADQCWVLDGTRGLEGLVAIYEGGRGSLVETYLASHSRHSPFDLLVASLSVIKADEKPAYFRVRDYMACQQYTLQDGGFELIDEQMVMYRQTAARVGHQALKSVEKVEGRIPIPSSIADI